MFDGGKETSPLTKSLSARLNTWTWECLQGKNMNRLDYQNWQAAGFEELAGLGSSPWGIVEGVPYHHLHFLP